MTGAEGQYYVLLSIDDTKCDYCLECVSLCPSNALTYDKCFEHNPSKCTNCEVCSDICEQEAINIRRPTI